MTVVIVARRYPDEVKGVKVCSHCFIEKPVRQFYPAKPRDQRRYKERYGPMCIECVEFYRKKYQIEVRQ